MSDDSIVRNSAVVQPPSMLWSFGALLIGAFGAPFVFLCGPLFELGSLFSSPIVSVAALLYAFTARKNLFVSVSPRRWNLMGLVGLILILLWAPLLFVLSIVSIVLHATG